MDQLLDFLHVKKFKEKPGAILYRGVRKSDSKHVIIKTLRSEFPRSNEIAALQHEHHMLEGLLEVPGVIRDYGLIVDQQTYTLLLEDSGGLSLDEFLAIKTLTLDEFFKISIQLVDILSEIHAHNIIHKDINPKNITISPIKLDIELTDFSIASQLPEEMNEILNPSVMEGTITHISPEQTGRMNCPLDYRSDFYSLGITFYEMLAKKLPFLTTDPLELLYCHIATEPPLLSDINPEIPRQLALIVQKLMAKNPNDRYESALGIKADLEKCAQQWKKKGEISEFPLAQSDVSVRLHISRQLYGRDEQIKQLLSSYERVSKGSLELVLVSGYSGIGKTTLVREVYKPMVREKGIFISGKYDQLQNVIPFSAFIQAFQSFIHQVLAQPEEELIQIRQNVLNGVKESGQVIIDVIPDLELLIGKQPEIPILSPKESQNRLMIVFQDFVSSLARQNHPLIIFLDDLQWVDLGSLKLLEAIVSDNRMKYLLFICAFRENEVNANHPFSMTINKLEKMPLTAKINYIVLKPLSELDVSHLLMDTFHAERLRVEPLKEIISDKTGCNPFFINEFLKTIYREHSLNFNYQKRCWQWSLEQIKALDISNNVIDLMINNIKKLSQEAQEMLKLASCIGNYFDFNTLVVISEQSSKILAANLWECMQKGLILAQGDSYKLLEMTQAQDLVKEDTSKEKVLYKFIHDRVQQAAYEMIPVTMRQQKNLSIGRLLLEQENNIEESSQIFVILNHFNNCLSLITDQHEKLRLAKLYLIAGKKAKLSTAYEASCAFLQSGVKILEGEQSWKTNYEILYNLYRELSESEYLNGNIELAEQYFDLIEKQARDKFDKSNILILKIRMYANLGKLEKGLEIGFSALELFDIHIPKKPTLTQVYLEFIKLKLSIGLRKIEDLEKSFVLMQDPFWIRVSTILFEMNNIAARINLNLLKVISIKRINIYIQHGFSTLTSHAFQGLARVLYSLGLYKNAFQATRVSEKLAQLILNTPEHLRLVSYMFFFHHLENDVHTAFNFSREAFVKSLTSGDFNYASWARLNMVEILHHTGSPLKELCVEADAAIEFFTRIKQAKFLYIMKLLSMHANFMTGAKIIGATELDIELNNPIIKEEKIVPSVVLGFMAESAYFSNNSLKALEIADDWYENFRHISTGMHFNDNYLTMYVLYVSDQYFSKSDQQRKIYLKRLKSIENELNIKNRFYPKNYSHLLNMVRAEIAVLKKDTSQATSLYDKAIEEAKSNHFPQYVAINCERASKFHRKLNKRLEFSYIIESYHYYLSWGALTKARQLEHDYPQWINEKFGIAQIGIPIDMATTSSSESLDFLSITKAMQTISKEIVLDKLLGQLIRIVLENAGAQRCVIMFKDKQKLITAAEGYYQNGKQIFLNELKSIDKRMDLPLSVLNYVLRTGESIVSGNLCEDNKFGKDPYVVQNHLKSVMCAPFFYHGESDGILYLENNLVAGVFTPQRIQVLNVLVSQAAISLENARYFEKMNNLYRSTERFVPKAFLEILKRENIEEVKLGDSVKRDITVLFNDIRSFTTLIENRSPESAFAFVNRYWKFMAPIIRNHGGYIDQYQGDAILAIFPGSAEDAIKASVAMMAELSEFNKIQAENQDVSIQMGISISTGPAMLGVIGENERQVSGLISDVANTASRIEGLNKFYGTSILISGDTVETLKSIDIFRLRLLDRVKLKGKVKATDIYELINWEDLLQGISLVDFMSLYKRGLNHYFDGQFSNAIEDFKKCLIHLPEDISTKVLLERSESFLTKGVPDHWDGVFVLTQK